MIFWGFFGITPGLEVLGQTIKVILFDRGKIGDGNESVLVDRILGRGIKADPLKIGTESDSSRGCRVEGS